MLIRQSYQYYSLRGIHFVFICIISLFCSSFVTLGLGPHEFLLQEECPNNTLVEGVGPYLRGLSRQGAKQFSLLKTGDKSSLFHMDPESGDLSTMQRIDRENLCPASSHQYGQPYSDLTTDLCYLSFSAINSDRQRLPFRLLIQDINDHAPQWPTSSLQLEFIENNENNRDHYNNFREIDRAVDSDSKQNSKISYQLKDESGTVRNRGSSGSLDFQLPFTLNEMINGNLRLQQTAGLDREKRDSYNATILAIDNGQPALTGTLSLHIRILDVNDNSPIFNASIYRTSIPLPENSPPGTTVLQVFATDADDGDNGRVSYSISQQNTNPAIKYFKIDAALGLIEVKSVLDFDRGPKMFKFTVLAHDNAPVPYRRTGSAEVEIKLADVADESPQIEINPVHSDPTTGDLCIKENNAVSVVVAFVQVTDPDFDFNDIIRCELNNRNFSLLHEETQQRNNYKIVTDISFDRESSPTQRIEVICIDDAGLRSIKGIRVRILDENDVTPEFPAIFKFELMENVTPKSPVFGQVQAKDGDEGENSRLTYSISPLDEAGTNFTVDPVSGNLQALVAFDRETEDKFIFRVLAVDHGNPPRTGTGTVQVTIQDENDCAPIFTQAHYNLSILENSLIGTVVGRVTANDNDIGKNGRVIYILHFSSQGDPRIFSEATHFSLDRLTGEIRTRQVLDREVKQTYQLTILAFDEVSENGLTKEVENYLRNQPDSILISLPPHLSKRVGITRVTITVVDANDNKPVFVVPSGAEDKDLLVLEKHDPQGKHILTANATDKDHGLNGEVLYTIVEGNTDNLFQIDSSSGTLFLIRPVHAASKALYQIKLQACDRSVNEPQHCTTSNAIRITIKGLNDNPNEKPYIAGEGVTRGPLILHAANNETVIIILTIVFLCLLVAVIALVCVIQKRSMGMKRSESPHKYKDTQNNYFPNCDDPMMNHRKDTNVIYEEKSSHQAKVMLTSRLAPGMDGSNVVLSASQDMLASMCSESVHNPLLMQPSTGYSHNQLFGSSSMPHNIYGSRHPTECNLLDPMSHSNKNTMINTGRNVSPSYQILDGHLMMNSINSSDFHPYQPAPLPAMSSMANMNSPHQRERLSHSPAPPPLNSQHSVVSYHPYFEIKTLDRPRSLAIDRRKSGGVSANSSASNQLINFNNNQAELLDANSHPLGSADHYNAGVGTYRRNGSLGGRNSAMSASMQPNLFQPQYLQQQQQQHSAFHTPYPPARKFGFAPIKETNSPGSGAVGSPLTTSMHASHPMPHHESSRDVNYLEDKKPDSYDNSNSPHKKITNTDDPMLHELGGGLVNMIGFRTLERAPSHTSKYAYDAYKEASFV